MSKNNLDNDGYSIIDTESTNQVFDTDGPVDDVYEFQEEAQEEEEEEENEDEDNRLESNREVDSLFNRYIDEDSDPIQASYEFEKRFLGEED